MTRVQRSKFTFSRTWSRNRFYLALSAGLCKLCKIRTGTIVICLAALLGNYRRVKPSRKQTERGTQTQREGGRGEDFQVVLIALVSVLSFSPLQSLASLLVSGFPELCQDCSCFCQGIMIIMIGFCSIQANDTLVSLKIYIEGSPRKGNKLFKTQYMQPPYHFSLLTLLNEKQQNIK